MFGSAPQKPTFHDAMEHAVYSVAKDLLVRTGLSDATFDRGLHVLGQERLIYKAMPEFTEAEYDAVYERLDAEADA